MKRLPIRGSAICTPSRSKDELEKVFRDLGVSHAFDDASVDALYWDLGAIIGTWLAEQESKESSPVAKALLTTARNLTQASGLLNGFETGIHNTVEIAVTSQVAEFLALDPGVGTLVEAQKQLDAFQRDAARISHVCLVAYADLVHDAGERGRPELKWYDDFTALVLDIGDKAAVKPTFGKDRINESRSGWLFDAAWAFESFLHPSMLSPSPEACGKRLERSRAHLRKAHRQKPRLR